MRRDFQVFLSHLCGDEGIVGDVLITIIFLSHLCGDEGSDIPINTYSCFLSHLCGDEGTQSTPSPIN